jgi:uncharacterized protein (TIGR02231 family)
MSLRFFVFCVFLWYVSHTLPPAAAMAAAPAPLGADFYPYGAKFVFQVEPRPDGNFEFELPGAFDPDSVRFLKREALVFVRAESVTREDWTPPALQSLRSKIDAKDRELKLLRSRQAAVSQAIERLNFPLPKDFGGKDIIFYLEESHAMLSRLGAERVDLDLGAEKAEKELNALRAEYERGIPDGAEAAVKVEGSSAEGGPLLFEAFTRSAGWTVLYDMNLDSATGDIRAAMRAQAWQKTGIDAAGEFTFHTRQPSFAIQSPEVWPLTVSLKITQPSPHPSRSEIYDAPDALMETAADAPMPEPRAPQNASKKEMNSLPSVTPTLADVSVKGKGALKGDGTPEEVSLGPLRLKSVPVLVSIPEQNREAWIIASMDSIPQPLLPGTAKLSVDGALTGALAIPEYGGGQTYLPFGMTSRLTARKNRRVSKTGSSWLGKGILEDGYTLEITNGMDAERELTVKDRIPVPVSDKISIEVTKIDPAPTERDEDNRLTWKIAVKPGETKKIAVEYTLRYPGEETLEYR